MIWDTSDRTKVFVVDSNAADYASLVTASAKRNTEVVFFENGQDALKAASKVGPAMWVVNIDLPDMRGTELRSQLRNRGNKSPLALVGNEYSVEDEIAARSAGCEMYFAKSMVQQVLGDAA